MSRLALGLDLGSSGLRLALLDPSTGQHREQTADYPESFEDPSSWTKGLSQLCAQLSPDERRRIGAMAVDGTSGTLLLCRPDGTAPSPALARALPYHLACPDQAAQARAIAGGEGPATSASGSLARALQLLATAHRQGLQGPLLLRHQADWLMGWLLRDWRWGEEGNNARLGWDARVGAWSGAISSQPWSASLPAILASGSIAGTLDPEMAQALDLPPDCRVMAGSTDSSAGVLAACPGPGEGITVLGTTLVLKQTSEIPLLGAGISCQRVANRWLVGGASNAGGGVLRRFFDDQLIAELSRQIDPERDSGLRFRPLPGPGERFPVDDPDLPPILGPRPVSDALFLQGLLEGLAHIELQGWSRLRQLGAPPLHAVVTLGGGAKNPQWRRLRERILGVPVRNRPELSAALGMARLAADGLPPDSGAPRMEAALPQP